jgi:integrase
MIVHPETGEPFASRAAVEYYIEELRASSVHGFGATVGELAKHMFMPDGPWAQRQARRRDGRDLAAHTLQEHELNARLHIIPAIGLEAIRDVDTQMIDRMLYLLDLSNRARRNIAGTLRAVLKEAVYRRIISAVPPIELPEKKSKKPAVLTLEELRELFPTGRRALQRLWAGESTRQEPAGASLALAACCAVMFFGGLRPQEARAVQLDQLIRRLSVLLVTRSMNGEGRANNYLKMGGDRDPRYRGTFLVDRAMQILGQLLKVRPEEEFLFTYAGRPIRPELLHSRLRLAAERAKILPQGRRIIPYSGRYTFDTTVKTFLPREILMLLMGHIDQAMPERYDIPVLVERMKQMAPHLVTLNKAIG